MLFAFCDRLGESPCTALPQANSIGVFYCFFNQEQGVSADAVSESLVPLYSCNTLQTKVNGSLTQDSKVGKNRIVEERKHHEAQHKGKSDTEADFLNFHAERTPSHCFDQIVQQVSAVEHGHG